jgi:NAD-dependent deacetylase
MTEQIEIPGELISILKTSQRVTVLTGAGISAESGVPTFRDALTGLWARFRPEELATPEAFRRDPKLVWEWYEWRRELVARAEPNPGHLALAEMEKHIPDFYLVTQNVDGLHQRAGSGRVKPGCVIELHGSIQRTKCFEEDRVVESWEANGEVPPRCPHCKGLLRPDVVWFGEMLPKHALTASMKAARSCQMFFSVGTSALVQPAASLPYIASDQGATVVEVNPQPTPFSEEASYSLRGPAGKILPEIIRAVWGERLDSN